MSVEEADPPGSIGGMASPAAATMVAVEPGSAASRSGGRPGTSLSSAGSSMPGLSGSLSPKASKVATWMAV